MIKEICTAKLSIYIVLHQSNQIEEWMEAK